MQQPSIRARVRPRRCDPGDDAALHNAAAKPALYRRHPGQEAGRAGRSEEGRRHRGSERFGAKAVVEIERVAGIQITVDAEKMRADYECTQSA